MAAEFRNHKATVLYNALPHLFQKIVRNDGRPPTVFLIMHILPTSCKLPAYATHHLLVHGLRLIHLTQLTMNFNRLYSPYVQNLYHKSNLAVGGRWNKSRQLQPLYNATTVSNWKVPPGAYDCKVINLSRTHTSLSQGICWGNLLPGQPS